MGIHCCVMHTQIKFTLHISTTQSHQKIWVTDVVPMWSNSHPPLGAQPLLCYTAKHRRLQFYSLTDTLPTTLPAFQCRTTHWYRGFPTVEVVLQKQFSMFIASKTGKEASVFAAVITMKFTCRHCSAMITRSYGALHLFMSVCRGHSSVQYTCLQSRQAGHKFIFSNNFWR